MYCGPVRGVPATFVGGEAAVEVLAAHEKFLARWRWVVRGQGSFDVIRRGVDVHAVGMFVDVFVVYDA